VAVDPFEAGKRYADYLRGLSDEQRNPLSQKNMDSSMAEHKRFSTSFKAGRCYVCGKKLGSFDRTQPCFHWFLRPRGFEKKDIVAVAERFGFFRIQSYLRWVANEDGFAKNINDLLEEGTGKFIEVTIKYQQFEWSFSVAESDLKGHPTTEFAKHSHYHLQMKIDDRMFISYNDFHLPFSNADILNISARQEMPDIIKHKFPAGEGMQDMMTDEVVEAVINAPKTGGEEDAVFSLDSMIEAEEGTTIKGEDLYNIFQEAKEKGVTIASLLHKLPNAKTAVTVTPGPAVVKQAPRSGGRKKR